MTRTAILRDDLRVPASDDFVAAFGCDFEFDELTHTELYAFGDELHRTLKIWIGTLDRTLSLSIVKDGIEIVAAYNECLSSIHLDEDTQTLAIIFDKDRSAQKLELFVWPRIRAVFTWMR